MILGQETHHLQTRQALQGDEDAVLAQGRSIAGLSSLFLVFHFGCFFHSPLAQQMPVTSRGSDVCQEYGDSKIAFVHTFMSCGWNSDYVLRDVGEAGMLRTGRGCHCREFEPGETCGGSSS